jgi:hypothetical protein
VRGDLVYGACFHDWAQIRYRETEARWLAGLMEHAAANGVEMLSYAEFHRRAKAARVPA